jgi:Tol biopolymer transport system component
MNEWNSTTQFEESVVTSFDIPGIRPEFVDHVYGDLMQRAEAKSRLSKPILRLRPAWIAALAIIALVIVGTLAIGPQRVYAEIIKLFAYIPGVGVVDTSASIRVLEEPVSVTRDGITVTVTSATLTASKTQIAYRIFGVPGSSYPQHEDEAGCTQREYLRLSDGTQLVQVNGGYEPVAENVNEAVFVIPCIVNTLPGMTPQDWELPLRFVPASPDLTIMPVIDLSPSPQVSQIPDAATGTAADALDEPSVTVTKVIETSDGYILIGQFLPNSKPGESFQQTGAMEIRDATGKRVSYTYPMDVNDEINQESGGIPGAGWAAQFKAAGLAYPLTIRFTGITIFPAGPDVSATFTFDAGSNPQPGQEWTPNEEIQLDGHILTLVSISVDSRGGYSFNFQVGPDVHNASVQIDGYTPNGGGGGLSDGKFNVNLNYAQLPTGVLTATISNLALVGDSVTWQGQWSPTAPRTDLPANPTPQPGLCLTLDSLEQLLPAPVDLTGGTALLYEQLDDPNKWGLVLYNLNGGNKQILAADAGWGSLSPDGSQMAYEALDGIHVIDLVTKTERVLANVSGFGLSWSQDGEQIAYIGMDNGLIDSVFVVNADGTQVRQVSEWSYESIIGWSPEGKLYSVVPFTGAAAWKVFAFDLSAGTAQELFTIENGTPKFLNPHLSPDGNLIAYRGRDSSSLYLVRTDGSDMRLVLNNVGAVGMGWSQSGWLGVSLRKENSEEQTVILLKPETCEAYQLSTALHGTLQGIYIP